MDTAIFTALQVANNTNYVLTIEYTAEGQSNSAAKLIEVGDTSELLERCTIGNSPESALDPDQMLEHLEVIVEQNGEDFVVYAVLNKNDWNRIESLGHEVKMQLS